MATWQQTAREDGYIECSECGHILEWDHTLSAGCGADGCTCRVKLTRMEVSNLREAAGLTRTIPKHLHV
jgi:hypothetical protein